MLCNVFELWLEGCKNIGICYVFVKFTTVFNNCENALFLNRVPQKFLATLAWQ